MRASWRGLTPGFLLMLALAGEAVSQSPSQTPMPTGWQATHVQPVAYYRVAGPRAFKLGLRQMGTHWFLFVAVGGGGTGPDGVGFEVVDVTDAAAPRHVATVAVSNGDGQLTLHGDLLIAGRQLPYASPDVGGTINFPYRGLEARPHALATLFDISDPRAPKRLSDWTAPGWGTHRNSYPGGCYAFMSAWIEGYSGQAILVLLDVGDPTMPKEAGRWWWPGQKNGEAESPLPSGYHGPATLSADGRMLTLGYAPGLVNLDISDPARPRVIARLVLNPLAPLGMQALHSVVPIGGGLFHVSSEVSAPGCDKEHLPLAAIVDNRDPTQPRLVANYPRPTPPPGVAWRSFCDKDGRFGPHNVNTELHEPGVQPPNGFVYMTYFNAGLRIYDVSDPRAPVEAGWFLPEMGRFQDGFRGLEDVLVDTRGNAFVTDGRGRGVWVLRYIGRSAG